MNTTQAQQISSTILTQLGGRRFIAMTGCKNFVFDHTNGALSFKLPGMVRKIATHVKIKLNALDLYDMEFIKIKRNGDMVTIDTRKGIYNDMLQACFSKTTGLATHL